MLLFPGLILINVTIISQDLNSLEFQIIILENFKLNAAMIKLGNILVLYDCFIIQLIVKVICEESNYFCKFYGTKIKHLKTLFVIKLISH